MTTSFPLMHCNSFGTTRRFLHLNIRGVSLLILGGKQEIGGTHFLLIRVVIDKCSWAESNRGRFIFENLDSLLAHLISPLLRLGHVVRIFFVWVIRIGFFLDFFSILLHLWIQTNSFQRSLIGTLLELSLVNFVIQVPLIDPISNRRFLKVEHFHAFVHFGFLLPHWNQVANKWRLVLLLILFAYLLNPVPKLGLDQLRFPFLFFRFVTRIHLV